MKCIRNLATTCCAWGERGSHDKSVPGAISNRAPRVNLPANRGDTRLSVDLLAIAPVLLVDPPNGSGVWFAYAEANFEIASDQRTRLSGLRHRVALFVPYTYSTNAKKD